MKLGAILFSIIYIMLNKSKKTQKRLPFEKGSPQKIILEKRAN